MPIPAGLALAGKLLTYGSTGLLIDDLTGKNLQRILRGTPEAQRNYKVDADGNFQQQVPKKIESKPKTRNFLEQFLFGIPEAERKYTVNDAYEYEARTPTSVTSPPPATNLPPSPEETPAMMDPYAYNLAVYGQGRTAAGTQEERKAVQNLGMAIHQRLFPKFDNKTSFNPLMDHLKRTFPDRYPQSLDALIEERGIQKPASMTEADSAVALADATNAVEPLLTPEVAEQLRLARQQGRL
jgi:hypothetical protein